MQLTINDLSVNFGMREVLRNASVVVPTGRVVSLIGSNGSGKTTLFNCVTGFLKPASGKVLLGQTDMSDWPVWKRARGGIRRTFQNAHVISGHTVLDNLAIAGTEGVRVNRKSNRKKTNSNGIRDSHELLAQLKLEHLAHHQVDSLSFGQRKLVTLAMATVCQPTVLLLDEPAAGVAPGVLPTVAGFIRSLKCSVLVIEHNIDFLAMLGGHAMILSDGQVNPAGEISEVIRKRQLKDIYT